MLTVYSNLKQTNFFAKENMYANFQNLDLKNFIGWFRIQHKLVIYQNCKENQCCHHK